MRRDQGSKCDSNSDRTLLVVFSKCLQLQQALWRDRRARLTQAMLGRHLLDYILEATNRPFVEVHKTSGWVVLIMRTSMPRPQTQVQRASNRVRAAARVVVLG